MRTWLINHAEQNVWAKPGLDGQLNIKLSRVSSRNLDRTYLNVHGETVSLPTQGDFYAIYNVGYLHAKRGQLNINHHEGWVKLSTVVNRTGAMVFVYDINGKRQPAVRVFAKRLLCDGLIFAIKADAKLLDVRNSQLYLRVYDHYIKHDSEEGNANGLTLVTQTPTDGYNLSQLIDYYNQLKLQEPSLRCFVNGIYREGLTTTNVFLKDIVEFYVDGSVKRVVRLPVSGMRNFMSTLDDTKKYLVHFPKTDSFDFHDDIDVYLWNGQEGRYYNKHFRSSMTQLTHGDFALSAKQIEEYTVELEASNLEVLFFIKKSGFSRELLFNDYRIHELYRLSDTEIVNVMTGLNSTLPFWRASELEKSDVNRLRTCELRDIDHKLSSDAYGYNAALYYSANTPMKTEVAEDGRAYAVLPALVEEESTVYEYNLAGHLNGWWTHQQATYICRRNDTHIVEAIPGFGGEDLNIVWGADGLLISRYQSYRFYLQKLSEGVPIEEYIDVTGDDDIVEVDDGFKLTWNYDTERYRSVVLSDKRHLIYKETISESEGLIRVGVKHKLPSGAMVPCPFKFATLEVFLNNKPMVYGIDYLVDWPSITINNKTQLKPGSDQEVVVRARVPAAELVSPKTGFVVGGLLSENDHYDIKDDKVNRIVIGGSIKTQDAVKFREDEAAYVDGDLDGLPYSVDSPAMAVGDLLEGNYDERRLAALERDQLVEDFLTIHYPRPIINPEQPLQFRYPLYSPLFNKIITDEKNGDLVIVEDDDTYKVTTKQIDDIVARYDYLLKSDPAYIGVNDWFVVVDPHWGFGTVEITALLYTVLERINSRFYNKRVDLNRYLTIRND